MLFWIILLFSITGIIPRCMATTPTENVFQRFTLDATTDSVTFTSPHFDFGNYPDNSNNTWEIVTQQPNKVRIQFAFFRLEYQKSCLWDFVRLTDSKCSESIGARSEIYCGVITGLKYNSSANALCVEFISDFIVNRKGFKAVAEIIKAPSDDVTSSSPETSSNDQDNALKTTITELTTPITSTSEHSPSSSSTSHPIPITTTELPSSASGYTPTPGSSNTETHVLESSTKISTSKHSNNDDFTLISSTVDQLHLHSTANSFQTSDDEMNQTTKLITSTVPSTSISSETLSSSKHATIAPTGATMNRVQNTNTDKLPELDITLTKGTMGAVNVENFSGIKVQTPKEENGKYPLDFRSVLEFQNYYKRMLTVTFESFKLEYNQFCSWDYLVINTSYSNGPWCGSILPSRIDTVSESVHIEFYSDIVVPEDGFEMRITIQRPQPSSSVPLTAAQSSQSSGSSVSTNTKTTFAPQIASSTVQKLLTTPYVTTPLPTVSTIKNPIVDNPATSGGSTLTYSGTSESPSLVTFNSNKITAHSGEQSSTSSSLSFTVSNKKFENTASTEGSTYIQTSSFPTTGVYTTASSILTKADISSHYSEVSVCNLSEVSMDGADAIVVKSPKDENGKYPVNLHCLLKIRNFNKKVLKIEFTEFQLESNTYCSYDFVTLYTPDKHGPHCGDKLPGGLITNSDEIVVEFRSNSNIQDTGFTIHLTTTQGNNSESTESPSTALSSTPTTSKLLEILTDPTQLSLSGQTYSKHASTSNVKHSTPGTGSLTTAHMASTTTTVSGSTYFSHSSTGTEESHSTTDEEMTLSSITTKLTPSSSPSTNYPKESQVVDICVKNATEVSERISVVSPGFLTGSAYPPSRTCLKTIHGSTGEKITMQIESFDIEKSSTCAWDALSIHFEGKFIKLCGYVTQRQLINYNITCNYGNFVQYDHGIKSRTCFFDNNLSHTFTFTSESDLLLNFLSDGIINKKGFRITLRRINVSNKNLNNTSNRPSTSLTSQQTNYATAPPGIQVNESSSTAGSSSPSLSSITTELLSLESSVGTQGPTAPTSHSTTELTSNSPSSSTVSSDQVPYNDVSETNVYSSFTTPLPMLTSPHTNTVKRITEQDPSTNPLSDSITTDPFSESQSITTKSSNTQDIFSNGRSTMPQAYESTVSISSQLTFKAKTTVSLHSSKLPDISTSSQSSNMTSFVTITDNAESTTSKQTKPESSNAVTEATVTSAITNVDVFLSSSTHSSIENSIPTACSSAGRPSSVLHDFGYIASPIAQNKSTYPPNILCQWQFVDLKDQLVSLIFEWFDLEQTTGCRWDKLSVYEIHNRTKERTVAILCGSTLPQTITVSNNILIEFESDTQIERTGFRLKYLKTDKYKTDPSFSCPSGMTACLTRKSCMPAEWICDGEVDCPDMTDEIKCLKCKETEFDCGGGVCIGQKQKCDGHKDCPYGLDEQDCVSVNQDGDVSVTVGGTVLPLCYNQSLLTNAQLICSASLSRMATNVWSKSVGDDHVSGYAEMAVVDEITAIFKESTTCNAAATTRIRCHNSACGKKSTHAIRKRIIGGELSKDGEWPWIVALRIGPNVNCGGIIINKEWILTAGHCVKDLRKRPQVASIIAGVKDKDDVKAQIRYVTEVVLHPQYSYIFKADIALLKLQRPLLFNDYVQQICLPWDGRQFALSSRCFIAGWGLWNRTDHRPFVAPRHMRHAKTKLVSWEKCNASYTLNSDRKNKITKDMICAGYSSGTIDACRGDSGSGLMCQVSDGRWVVAGVVSWGDKCGKTNKPGVYTKVSSYVNWINETLGQPGIESINCTFETSDWCGYQAQSNSSYIWTRKPDDRMIAGHILYAVRWDNDITAANATLITPQFNSGHDRCLEFQFSFSVNSKITLSVYGMRHDLTMTEEKPADVLLWRVTSHYPLKESWQTSEINVPDNVNRLKFVSLHNQGLKSGLGLDNVTLMSRPCSGTNFMKCDFNKQDLCQYTNPVFTTYNKQWKIKHKNTSTDDYVLETGGPYGSFGDGATSQLVSPTLSTSFVSLPRCITFSFYKEYNTTNELKVITSTKIDQQRTFWSSRGAVIGQWHKVKVTVARVIEYFNRIVLEVKRDAYGDIYFMIDDLDMYDGHCV